MYPVLYDNLLFLTLFLFPPRKRGKKNEVAKPVLNHFFFQDRFEIHPDKPLEF